MSHHHDPPSGDLCDDHCVALGSRRPTPKRAPAGHGVAQPDPSSTRSQRPGHPWLIADLRGRILPAVDAGIYRDPWLCSLSVIPGPGRFSWARSSRTCRRLDVYVHEPAVDPASRPPFCPSALLPFCEFVPPRTAALIDFCAADVMGGCPLQRMVVPSGWSSRLSSSCVGRPSQSPGVPTAKAAVVTARCRRDGMSAPLSSPDR